MIDPVTRKVTRSNITLNRSASDEDNNDCKKPNVADNNSMDMDLRIYVARKSIISLTVNNSTTPQTDPILLLLTADNLVLLL
jgi:hypothetical protein